MNACVMYPVKREPGISVSKRPLRGLSVRQATLADVFSLTGQASEFTGGLAGAADVSRIISHNGECLWVVERTSAGGVLRRTGFHAFLPLSPEGEATLLCARFAFRLPDLRHIDTVGRPVTALYWWASPGTGTSATAVTLITQHLGVPPYCNLDIYAQPTTRHGARVLLNANFRPVASGAPAGSVAIYRRLANRIGPPRCRLN